MVTSKAAAIAKEIDVARCKGNWQAIPELARRYKKHNPSGTVLEQSILGEAGLDNIVHSSQRESRSLYANDSPSSISLPKCVDRELTKPVLQHLSTAIADNDSSSEAHVYKTMSKVILARTYFESGQYQKAVETFNEIDLKILGQSSGYASILYVQALSVRAMSYDLNGDKSSAWKAYDDLVSLVNQSQHLSDRSLVDWAEEGLYRGTLLALNERQEPANVPRTMNLIRAYQKICSSQTSVWRSTKRLAVTKYSANYLSEIYRAGYYQAPIDYSVTEEGKHINELAADFELINASETELRGFIDVLNRASTKTFNSPCVTRHLFHALVQLGDYEEAELALRTYLYLVGLESKALLDGRSMTPALATDALGYNIPVPSSDIKEEISFLKEAHKSDGPQRSEEQETAESKIKVLITAVHMYCKELCKGSEAVYVAELAADVYTTEVASRKEQSTQFEKVGVEVFRSLGVAFGFLGSQTFDPDSRPKFHQKAVNSLKRSLEFDTTDWKTYYQLALQLAGMRDIAQAIPMITQSLQYNSGYLPSWHLFALLLTCPSTDNQTQALKTCEMALSKVTGISENDQYVDYNEEIAQQLLLQMTQTLLIDRVHGSEKALASQANLFQVFGKIVVPELIPNSTHSNMVHEAISMGPSRYGIVNSGSLGNMSTDLIASSSTALATSDPNATARGRSTSSIISSNKTVNGRARSASSFTGRKFHLAEMFNAAHHDKTDANSVRSATNLSHVKNNGSKLSLLDPMSVIRKQKKDTIPEEVNNRTDSEKEGSIYSFNSAAPSFISTNTLLQSTTTPIRPTTQARLLHQRSHKLLCDLWLLSAEIYLRANRIDEAFKAVSEAENVDSTTHPGVWCLLGRIRFAQGKRDKAIVAFQKGLFIRPNDVDCRIWLAKTYMDKGDLEVAEGLLQAATRENGWDNAAAWYYLGEIYKKTDRLSRTKDCLFYALELESRSPIQPFSILPRVI
ncbi:hypothetical protein BDF20DRAFT_709137 [Mycotypha africana]|uniref:uncharacterized protein n=1 Tax=Mycotypha africana TaxID=64632 RepID=UPI002301D3DB|nr:uncharacterized protein BDF20DRAFT_709137 [Mycotypha africana]KAI8971935.1 hypothetical protein BDF20DRAFT_709137 [Mycotypha africana]